MSRQKSVPLEKVTLNLEAGDRETLIKFYPQVGWSVVVRHIIKKYCARLNELESQQSQPFNVENIEPIDLSGIEKMEPIDG